MPIEINMCSTEKREEDDCENIDESEVVEIVKSRSNVVRIFLILWVSCHVETKLFLWSIWQHGVSIWDKTGIMWFFQTIGTNFVIISVNWNILVSDFWHREPLTLPRFGGDFFRILRMGPAHHASDIRFEIDVPWPHVSHERTNHGHKRNSKLS